MERKAWKSNSGENEEMDSNLGVQHLTNFITHNHRIEEKDSDDFSLEVGILCETKIYHMYVPMYAFLTN